MCGPPLIFPQIYMNHTLFGTGNNNDPPRISLKLLWSTLICDLKNSRPTPQFPQPPSPKLYDQSLIINLWPVPSNKHNQALKGKWTLYINIVLNSSPISLKSISMSNLSILLQILIKNIDYYLKTKLRAMKITSSCKKIWKRFAKSFGIASDTVGNRRTTTLPLIRSQDVVQNSCGRFLCVQVGFYRETWWSKSWNKQTSTRNSRRFYYGWLCVY